MLKPETKTSNGNWPARACDTCRTAACTVYCRADLAYLCTSCDARIHTANQVASRHERVWVCEACERAPAAFLCKADAASLCEACDSDIHSANPLSRRHHRVPIMPIPGILYGPSLAAAGELMIGDGEDEFGDNGTPVVDDDDDDDDDEDEAASWLLLNPVMKNGEGQGNGGGQLFGDEYLDLEDYNGSCHQFSANDHGQQQEQGYGEFGQKGGYGGGDSVVPIQYHHDHHKGKDDHHHVLQQQHSFHLGLDYENSNNGYGAYSTSTMSQSVSLSPMDVGVVPESTMSEVSICHPRPPKGTIDLFSGPPVQLPTQLTPMDREARVMRYREKKKTRKFEKTIRYASRKAYAETRPRIKGRFAKRTDVEVEVDQMFSASLMTETAYGVVPSF